jgi:hypothetical protein
MEDTGMSYVMMWAIFWGVIGSFGTAFIHEKTGRDVQMGGVLGFIVGAVGSIFFLMILWVYLYYGSGGGWSGARMYGKPRRVWYRWWE